MKQNRAQVQKWIGLSEGGYVNNPKDPGGPTDRGITQRTFDAWRKKTGKPKAPVKGISKAEAEDIIAMQYMDPVGFDDLPSGLDYAMADYSVNSGPAKAVKDLQKIVGVSADGIMGTMTLAAVSRYEPGKLIVALCNRRMAFVRGLRTWGTFGKGWTTRIMGKVDGVQASDIGVIDRAMRMAQGDAVIPAPVAAGNHKAPEPPPPETVAEDGEAKGALVGAGGAVAASGGILSAISSLDPMVQALAVGGLVVAIASLLFIFRKRLARLAE